MQPCTVVDLFAGVGGLSYGFHDASSFKIVAANEILPDMAAAYSLNYPDVLMYNTDIGNFGFEDVPGSVDVVIGGPPCQAYSSVGRGRLNIKELRTKAKDPRASLFEQYCRVLYEMNPRMFVFENVTGLLSMEAGNLFPHICQTFRDLGYVVCHKVLNAADYGVPQMRERVVIVGAKVSGHIFEFPAPTCKTHLTVKDAIGDLPFIKSGESSENYASDPQNDYQRLMREGVEENGLWLVNHNAPKHNADLIAFMEMLPDGGTPEDLPCLPDWFKKIKRFGNTYCRLWWEKPSTTVTRNFGTPSSSRCIHPKVARGLTTREGARLQSFPDRWMFCGSRSTKNLQVGNAVPPLLSKALAGAVLSHLLKSR